MILQRLIPRPCSSYEDFQRATGADLAELTPLQAWAESTRLEAELARRIWYRDRTRIAGIGPDGSTLTIDWLKWRIAQLRPLVKTRGARCA